MTDTTVLQQERVEALEDIITMQADEIRRLRQELADALEKLIELQE